MLNRCLAQVAILAVGMYIVSASQYTHRKFSTKELEFAEEVAEYVITDDPFWKSWRKYKPTEAEKKCYSKVDFAKEPRYDAVGVLVTAFVKDEGDEFNYDYKFADQGQCTAFFVAPDILATAAHCVQEPKVKQMTGPQQKVIIFVQQFDGSQPYTGDLAKQNQRIVSEFIYPAKYDEATCDWSYGKGFDYAFLRIKGKPYAGTPYTLASPEPFFSGMLRTAALLQMVGYPGEFADVPEAVAVTCKLYKADAKVVKEDKGIEAYLKLKGASIEAASGNQVFCTGGRGNMQAGGSGGPWFVSEDSKNDRGKATKLSRVVIGLTGWALKRFGTDGRQAPQALLKATAAAWLNKDAIAMYEKVKKAPAGKSLLEALA